MSISLRRSIGVPIRHEVCVGTLDRLAEVFHLLAPVAHRRQKGPDLRIVLEGLRDRADREGAGVDERRGAEFLGGEDGCAVRHLAVCQCRTVFDCEHALARDLGCVALDLERRVCEHHLRARRIRVDRLENRIDSFLRRAVHLVDDADVRHAEVRLARVVAQLVPWAVRIDDDDVEVGLDERRVVIAAVPQDHVGFLFRRAQDLLVVDAGEDEVSFGEMWLVLLALLDRRIGGFEVLVALEALHGLFREISVRHRMPEDGDLLAGLAEEFGGSPGGLALAGSGADRADRDGRLARSEHRLARRDQAVRSARRERTRADVHHVLVRHVRVGEDDVVDLMLPHELLERGLGQDRNPFRIQRPGELGRIPAPVDVRDLRRGEGDHLALGPVPIDEVEVVKVASGSAGDQHPCPGHA